MKKIVVIIIAVALLVSAAMFVKNKFYDPRHRLDNARSEVSALSQKVEIKNGDLIFQTSLSRQSQAIQLATKSKYSHCGIIYKNGNGYFVLEAVQPVKLTPLAQWIAGGKDGDYVIKRLKNADNILTAATLQKMKDAGEQMLGKKYDLAFEWSDEKMYCSELIWKIYKRATGLDLGKLQRLGDFDLSNETVKKKMKERYGNNVPLDEKVISPAAIFDSELLTTVNSNW